MPDPDIWIRVCIIKKSRIRIRIKRLGIKVPVPSGKKELCVYGAGAAGAGADGEGGADQQGARAPGEDPRLQHAAPLHQEVPQQVTAIPPPHPILCTVIIQVLRLARAWKFWGKPQ